MKDILKHFVIGLVIGLIASGLMVWSYNVGKRHSSNTVDTIIDTVEICDTITELKPQYITISHFDTVPMEVFINDTVTDTLLVMLPVEHYHYDSTIVDSNYTTHFSASLTGYKLSFDTLCLSTEIIENKPVPAPKKWYDNLGVGCGIMYGTGGWGVGCGIMFKIF